MAEALTLVGTLGLSTTSFERVVVARIAAATGEAAQSTEFHAVIRKGALDATPDTALPLSVPLGAITTARAIFFRIVNSALVRITTIAPGTDAMPDPTPSAVLADHDTDGTFITVKTTEAAHGIVVGQQIVLAGWAWATGGGDVNQTYLVSRVPAANQLDLIPALYDGVCPTSGSNPETVGTIVVGPLSQEHAHLIGDSPHPEGVYALFGLNGVSSIVIEDVYADGTEIFARIVGD